MPRTLPPRPNLRNLRNQAKTILKRHRGGDAQVCDTLRHLRRFARRSQEAILGEQVSLTEVQYALALDYGFKSWNELRAHVTDLAGRDESETTFDGLLSRATETYTRRGPSESHMGSEWDKGLRRLTAEVIEAGEVGWQVDVELSRSAESRLRAQAALHFGIRADARGKEHLARLMRDGNASVRRVALRWFAALIHPTPTVRDVTRSHEPAQSVPPEARHLAASAKDPTVEVRRCAIRHLNAYAGLADPVIDQALAEALGDPVHKVAHEAARVLQTRCAGCGHTPERIRLRAIDPDS